MDFRYDKVMIDPPMGTVEIALNEASEAANKGSKSHRCYPMDINVVEVRHSDSGRTWASGSIDPGHETSMLGLAWWTDQRCRKHIRVCSIRQLVLGHKARILFGVGSERWPPVQCVYPTAVYTSGAKEVTFRCSCGRIGTADDIGWDSQRCQTCRNKHEYEEDTGFQKHEVKR